MKEFRNVLNVERVMYIADNGMYLRVEFDVIQSMLVRTRIYDDWTLTRDEFESIVMKNGYYIFFFNLKNKTRDYDVACKIICF